MLWKPMRLALLVPAARALIWEWMWVTMFQGSISQSVWSSWLCFLLGSMPCC